MSASTKNAPSLDVATLDAVVARLRKAGGHDRAVALVEELRPLPPSAPPTFNAVGFVMSYLRARGAAHEDDILAMLSAREEEHAEQRGDEWALSAKPLAGLQLLMALAGRGDLVRDGQTYSMRPAIDTKMGCVERILPRRSSAT